MTTYTPMIQQYLLVKSDYQDAFLFFRLGDFYEMFFDDAIKASQILEITLTSRDGGSEDRIPMCGVPYHSAQGYIETLVQKGHKVAVCEQMEDPKATKGVVKREVVRVITPGTMTDGKAMDGKTNHYIAASEMLVEGQFALSYLDLSTGEGSVTIIEGDEKNVINELQSLKITELVVPEQLYLSMNDLAVSQSILLSIEESLTNTDFQPFVSECPEDLHHSIFRLLNYVKRTQKRPLNHIQSFTYHIKEELLSIDFNSKRNLELIQSIRGGDNKGTLNWLLDETVTAMGGRKLKQWLHQPLANRKRIEHRLEIVSEFLSNYFVRMEVRNLLKEVYDLERLAGRIAFGSAGGRDLAQLRESLRKVPNIVSQLQSSGSTTLQSLCEGMDDCSEVRELLAESISEHPPISVKEGDVIKDGYNERLDELRYASRNGKEWIAALEQQEKERTGIKSLKIGYNRIFGYYIEITKSNIHLADLSRYERKQTLANAERYITDELKEKEALILNADEESLALEYELFTKIREQIKTYIPRLQALASSISELDVFIGFAEVAEKYRFTKPVFHDGRSLQIVNGRHPVVEKMMNKQLYVPNDCELTDEKNMMLITGPNMSGKSTYMRQVALTIVMAQMGCYVPADEAVLPVTDQIFTRIGAADDLTSGQSTFMVEMMESQHAIVNATNRSLLLFDEIGRGTSTYDGMALAQAMMEYIHDEIGANTLFSTHYHELTGLDQKLDKLKNVHVAAAEQNGRVVFLHKVKSGPADKSYGIHVAELAELPSEIILRATEILQELENSSKKSQSNLTMEAEQLSLFDESQNNHEVVEQHSEEELTALKRIKDINITGTTPMEALQFLYELQNSLNKR